MNKWHFLVTVLLATAAPTTVRHIEQSELLAFCEQRANEACEAQDSNCFRTQRDQCFSDLEAFEPETGRSHKQETENWGVLLGLGVLLGVVLVLTVKLCWGTLELGKREKERGKSK